MWRNLYLNLKESAQSVLPISLIVIILHFTIAPMPISTLLLFIIGSILLIIGMSVFAIGADMAIMPMGDMIGAKLVKSKKLWFFILGSFILGVCVTIAEPDLQVLAKQVPAVPDKILVMFVAFGVGIFLVLALLRILFQLSLSKLLIILYGLVFLVAAFTAPDYLAVAFDSGGVTTGPITVPFILALGAGVSSVRSSRSAEEDSFGLCGICSIGPIIAVLIMGLFYNSSDLSFGVESASSIESISGFLILLSSELLSNSLEVLIALTPVVLIFGALQIIKLKLPKKLIIKIVIGLIYTLIGLALFLSGINIGFMPTGSYLGSAIADLSYNWILIPISILLGFFVVAAEPAVHVLNKQVEDITSGAISRKLMMAGLSVGVGIALAFSMIRIMTKISIWYFILPGYIISLALTFFVPPLFTAIAFDSGGVASGTMAAAFLLPFATGVSSSFGGNAMTDAFGIIALVAMMPLVTVQIIGFIYNIKLKKSMQIELTENNMDDDSDIIEF